LQFFLDELPISLFAMTVSRSRPYACIVINELPIKENDHLVEEVTKGTRIGGAPRGVGREPETTLARTVNVAVLDALAGVGLEALSSIESKRFDVWVVPWENQSSFDVRTNPALRVDCNRSFEEDKLGPFVDTKYELGLDAAGNFVVIDEIHTPDSSRYWYAEAYADAFSRGDDPKSLDKEYVRRWLQERGYHGDGPPPTLPDEVRCEAAQRYIETYERITGRAFEPATDEPQARIRRSLRLV